MPTYRIGKWDDYAKRLLTLLTNRCAPVRGSL